ncbi:hypothetical protein AB9R79_04135 [Vibrio splendidus]
MLAPPATLSKQGNVSKIGLSFGLNLRRSGVRDQGSTAKVYLKSIPTMI